MSKHYTLYTNAELRKGGRKIQKMSKDQFAEKAKKFILDNCEPGTWAYDKVENSNSADRIISYLPHAIKQIYWEDKKGKTAIKKDFKGIKPDWENYDIIGKLRTVKGAPYIAMMVGGDWECPICIMVYHDGHQFRCYIPEKGNSYRKDIKMLFGNYHSQYDSDTNTYDDMIKSEMLKKAIPSDDKYAFDQLVKDGILDKEKDIDKMRGIGENIWYDLNMCIEDFTSRVELNESVDFDFNAELFENISMKNITTKPAKYNGYEGIDKDKSIHINLYNIINNTNDVIDTYHNKYMTQKIKNTLADGQNPCIIKNNFNGIPYIYAANKYKSKQNYQEHVLFLDKPTANSYTIDSLNNKIDLVNPGMTFVLKDDNKDAIVYIAGHAIDRYCLRYMHKDDINEIKQRQLQYEHNDDHYGAIEKKAQLLKIDDLFDLYNNFICDNCKTVISSNEYRISMGDKGEFLAYKCMAGDTPIYILKTFITSALIRLGSDRERSIFNNLTDYYMAIKNKLKNDININNYNFKSFLNYNKNRLLQADVKILGKIDLEKIEQREKQQKEYQIRKNKELAMLQDRFHMSKKDADDAFLIARMTEAIKHGIQKALNESFN